MRIISITKGQYEEIETDELDYLNKYRRLSELQWEHYLGASSQWLAIRFCDQYEKAYQNYKEEHGEGNPDNNITNA